MANRRIKDKTKTALEVFQMEVNEAYKMLGRAMKKYGDYLDTVSDDPIRDSIAGMEVNEKAYIKYIDCLMNCSEETGS